MKPASVGGSGLQKAATKIRAARRGRPPGTSTAGAFSLLVPPALVAAEEAEWHGYQRLAGIDQDCGIPFHGPGDAYRQAGLAGESAA